jgi:large subunit ribosomal protein L25
VAEVKLTAELRTEFGKGAARRIRRADKVPAVLYGHGEDPVHLSLPGHATLLALREQNALLSIEYDGKAQLALPKQIQRDPLKGYIEHVDLITVRRGEKVTVDIVIHTEGESAVDTVVMMDRTELTVEAEATHIPEGVTVSVQDMEAGDQVHASDLKLPGGVELAVDPDVLILSVSASRVEEELEEIEEEAAEGEETAEAEESAEGGDAAEGESSDESSEG